MPTSEHNSIASEFDVFRHIFDMIVNEVKKYSACARKFEAKADKQFEQLKRDRDCASQN